MPHLGGQRKADREAEERRAGKDWRAAYWDRRLSARQEPTIEYGRRGYQRRKTYFSVAAALKYPKQMEELERSGSRLSIGEPFRNVPWEQFKKREFECQLNP